MLLNIIIRLAIALSLVSCQSKVIRETPIQIAPTQSYQKEETASLKKLEEYLKSVEAISGTINNLRKDIDVDKQTLDSLYDDLTRIDLFDTGHEVGERESKKYSKFLNLAEKISSKVDLDDLETKLTEIDEQIESSETEEKLVIDSATVRKHVEQISASAKMATDDKKAIENVLVAVKSQQQALKDKIDDAAQNFGAQSAEQKATAIDAVLGRVAALTSLDDVKVNIFDDPQFFSLLAELRRIPIWGQKIVELYVDDLPQRPAKILAEIKRIVTEAKAQKNRIDAIFSAAAPQPTSQEEVDRIINQLGTILDTEEFRPLIATRGVLRVEVARQNAIREIMDPAPPPRPANGPPPPPNMSPKPQKLIDDFKANVARINDNRSAPAKTKIIQQLRKLEAFYNINKIAVLIGEVNAAGDPHSARYQASYDSISDALMPYTVDSMRVALEQGGIVAGSDNEIEFFKNFIRIVKARVNDKLFEKIHQAVLRKISDRVMIVKNWGITGHPTIRQIENELATLDAINDRANIILQCNTINNNLSAVIQRPIDCQGIQRQLNEDYINANRAVPLWENGVLNKAKDRMKEVFETKLEIIRATGGKEEKVRIDVAGKVEEYDIPKGVTDVIEGIRAFNSEYLKLAFAIDVNALPLLHAYDIRSLTQDVVRMLRTEKIGEGRKSVIYADAIANYANELYFGMSPLDIAHLRANIEQTSANRLAKLHLVLSPKGYQAIIQPFDGPSEPALVESMKRAALGRLNDGNPEGAGIPDFDNALAAVFAATDDAGTQATINTLAFFFKNEAAHRGKVQAAAILPGVDNSANFGLHGQLGQVKTVMENNQKYQALKAIADLDGVDPTTITIVDDPLNSLDEKSNAISSTLRVAIFGPDGGERRVVFLFKELKTVLENALQGLKAQTLARGIPQPVHAGIIEPMANAFSLIFFYPLRELNNCVFDGTDDASIKTAFAQFNKIYAEKFARLKSVITGSHTVTLTDREIFKLLEGYTDGLGIFHDGLKQKVTSGSVSLETIGLADHVGDFLR